MKHLTVKDAIEMLQKYPGDSKLVLLDCDTSWMFPVAYIGDEAEPMNKLHDMGSFSKEDLPVGHVFVVSSNNYADIL